MVVHIFRSKFNRNILSVDGVAVSNMKGNKVATRLYGNLNEKIHMNEYIGKKMSWKNRTILH